MQDPLIKKRKSEAENQNEKRLKSDESVEDQVKNVTVSLSHEPYAKQMEIKKKEMHSVLAKLTQEIRKANFKIKPHIDKQIEIRCQRHLGNAKPVFANTIGQFFT